MAKIVRKYFAVQIDNPNLSATGNAAGFVEPVRLNDMADFNRFNRTAKTAFFNKALGYARWYNLVLAFTKGSLFYLDSIEAPIKISNVTYKFKGVVNKVADLPATSTANDIYFVKAEDSNYLSNGTTFSKSTIRFSENTPSSIGFTIGYEKFEDFYEYNGSTLLTGTDALKMALAKVLSSDYKALVSVYNPEISTSTKNPSTLPIGWEDSEINPTKIFSDTTTALASITITEIPAVG